MEKLYKQFVGWVTKFKIRLNADEFLDAHLKLIIIYASTVILIIAGFSVALYNSLLSNFATSIKDSIFALDPRIINLILDRTRDILLNRILVIDAIIVVFVLVVSIFLTKETLGPIKINMEKQKRFIADASHELRTPIAIVISGLEVALRNKDLDLEKAKKIIKSTLNEMRDFSSLSDHLLNISKHDSNKKEMYKAVLFSQLIKTISAKMQPIADKKDVHIKTNIIVEASVFGDDIELGRVLYNVLNNAITYSKEGGNIYVDGYIHKKNYVVVVKDEGVGMPKKVLDNVFEAFFRGDHSRNTSGAGLGLTLAKQIIESHKGTIQIKSEEGKGTEVIMTVPIYAKLSN